MGWLSFLLGTVRSSTQAAGKRGKVRARILGAPDDEHDRIQPYGFASRPQAGAECIAVPTGENHDELAVILVGDHRYIIALDKGEVVMHDDIGQRVHLARDKVHVYSPNRVTVDGGQVIVTSAVVRVGAGPGYAKPILEGDTVTVGAETGTIQFSGPAPSRDTEVS